VDSPGKRVFSHHFTLGANAVLFGYLIWQVGTTTVHSSRSWAPLILIALGCLLVLVDTCRHVLLDHGGIIFEPRVLLMYSPTGGLSPVGRSCQLATIFGLVFLVVGLALFFDLHVKIRSFFKERQQVAQSNE